MASPTKVTERKRKNKKVASGKARKAKIRAKGTTKSAKELFQD